MELEHIAQHSGRLSDFLKGEMGMSTGLMNRLKWKDRILVNGNPERTNYQVQQGDQITVELDEPTPEYPAEEMPLTIRYEDEHILVVDKPAGMLIHPSRHRNTGTLANGILGYYQKTGQACAFHPVTRLDRDTFGLVLLAKNSHVHRLLNDMHAEGTLQKVYHGLVYGRPTTEVGDITAPIIRCPLPSLLRKVDPQGQNCHTKYKVLETRENRSVLALTPVTGRTHQLRVHCAYIGCPILGDPQYYSLESMELSQRMGLSYQQLCAKELTFLHPITGEAIHLVSSLELAY